MHVYHYKITANVIQLIKMNLIFYKKRRKLMDLRYLQTFKEIVREGSFSGAARKLSYTQSTITFHMDQLEKELDTMLFEKVGRRMVLTKAG